MEDKILLPTTINSAFKFCCKKCDYTTFKKSSFDTHLLSAKHKRLTMDDNRGQNSAAEILRDMFLCHCGKKYQSRQGLWKHKSKCTIGNNIEPIKVSNDNNNKLIEYLMKENKEIKEMILEIVKNGTNNNTTTHTNSHNKAFNLNFFLNETCKDAMNITDFVDSIKLQLSDLEDVGRIGYIEGISNIIIKNLNNLDETKRPLHCTDKKRETIYVKDQGHWEKEDDNNSKIKKLISKVSSKNSKLLTEYREKYPDCKKCDSRISDKFNKMVIEAMGGLGDNNKEKEEKIIRNITKATTINK